MSGIMHKIMEGLTGKDDTPEAIAANQGDKDYGHTGSHGTGTGHIQNTSTGQSIDPPVSGVSSRAGDTSSGLTASHHSVSDNITSTPSKSGSGTSEHGATGDTHPGDHHVKREAALTGGAGTVGVGAYEAEKHHSGDTGTLSTTGYDESTGRGAGNTSGAGVASAATGDHGHTLGHHHAHSERESHNEANFKPGEDIIHGGSHYSSTANALDPHVSGAGKGLGSSGFQSSTGTSSGLGSSSHTGHHHAQNITGAAGSESSRFGLDGADSTDKQLRSNTGAGYASTNTNSSNNGIGSGTTETGSGSSNLPTGHHTSGAASSETDRGGKYDQLSSGTASGVNPNYDAGTSDSIR